MATANKFNCFVEDEAEKAHNLGSDTLKVHLTNTAPAATDTVFNTTQYPNPAAANGYTSGGHTVTITSSSQTSGTYTLVGNDVTVTATSGGIGPFRYVVFGNGTATKPICWWDYGSSITLASGETFTTDFGSSIISKA